MNDLPKRPSPAPIQEYHVFLASPGDVAEERRQVREFFDRYNRSTAQLWRARFEVVDWENYATIGVGRPQELITRHPLLPKLLSRELAVDLRCHSPRG